MSEKKYIKQRPQDGMTSDPAEVIFAGKTPGSLASTERAILIKVNELIGYLRRQYYLK